VAVPSDSLANDLDEGLYSIALIDVIKTVADQEGLCPRHPSGLFWRQQRETYAAWSLALEYSGILKGVTDCQPPERDDRVGRGSSP
jgi:hypothetical protein